MSWRGLRYKGTERLLSREWNAVIDSLNDLYGWLTDGTKDINVNEVYGRTAHFRERIDCEGRPVILDGDPISIYQFYDLAKSQITEAIDKSSLLSRAVSDLDQIYGKLPSKEDITKSIDSALVTQYTKESRDVLVRLSINEYGNVGVRITEPLDEYGRVVVSTPKELLDEFKPVSVSGSISATDNTAGFSVVLNKGGRPNVNVYYYLGGAGTVYLKVSMDGVTWRTLKTYTLASVGEGMDIVQGVAYPYISLETLTTGVDVTFEIVASR
jgi:hypothetical protein